MRRCAVWLSALSTLAVAAAAEDAVSQLAPVEPEGELTEEDKRAWQSLHGGWGKRGWQDMNSAWGKRAWQDLSGPWGKRAWNELSSAWGKRAWNDMNAAWGKRGWQDMNSAWGKRAWNDMSAAWGKRGWQDMNSAWGKRGWRDMSAAWGKRSRGEGGKWQNFHGSWGKRVPADLIEYLEAEQYLDPEQYEPEREQLVHQVVSSAEKLSDGLHTEPEVEKKAWNALHGTWGKRPVKQNNNGPYWKREPGWTNLRGMWGKRSNQWDLPEMAERQASYDYPERREEA